MKQKYMNKLLLLLALVLVFSIPAMSSAADAPDTGTVADYQVVLDKTAVKVGEPVNMVINLLDESGQVDLFANTYLSEWTGYFATVEVLDGNVDDDNEFASSGADSVEVDFYKGVGGTHIEFYHPGETPVRVTVFKYMEAGFAAEPTFVQVGESRDFTIVVSPAAAVTPENIWLDTNVVNAGEATTLKVLAEPVGVNGPLTMDIYYPGTDCDKVTLTGELVNGVAFVDLPAETLTKASGCSSYTVVFSTPITDGTFTDTDSITVEGLAASQVGVAVTDPSYINLDKDSTATAQVCLYDKYGNDAEAAEAVDVSLEATNGVVFSDGEASYTATIEAGNQCSDAIEGIYALGGDDAPDLGDDGVGSSTLSVSSDDFESMGTADITIYEKSLNLNSYVGEYYAGVTITNAMNVSVTGATVTSKRVKVELFDAAGSLIDSVNSTIQSGDNPDTTVVEVEGDVAVRFDKACADSETIKVSYISTDHAYGPAVVQDAGIVVHASEPVSLLLYQNPVDYNECLGTGTPGQPLTEVNLIDDGVNDSFTVVDGPGDSAYYGELLDAYGNQADGTIYWESDSAALNPVDPEDNELDETFTYNGVGSDTLTFYSDYPGVDPVEVTVNVAAEEVVTPPVLTSIELVPALDTMLANSEIPLAVKAYDADGEPYNWGSDDLTLIISDPSNVTVRENDRDDELRNGDTIPGASGNYTLSVLAGNTAGNVTLTVRNADDSVEGSVTLQIGEVAPAPQVGNPAAAADAVVFPATVDPTATPVVIAEGEATLAPQLNVDCADVDAAFAYIWMPAANAGFDLSSAVTSSCDAGVLTVDFGLVDFTGWPGTYWVYYGYTDAAGDIHYNGYQLTVE